MVPLSVLDLAPVPEGSDAGEALRNSADLAQHAGAARLSPLLDGRAPFDARASPAPPPRSRSRYVGSRHLDHPHRRGRDHAPQPRAAGHRRTVRHAGVAVSRPRSTSALAARPAPTRRRLTRCGATSTPMSTSSRDDVVELDGAIFAPASRPAGARGAGRRAGRPALDPRIEHLRRPTRRRARPALRLRLALRAGADDGGDRASIATASSPRRSSTSPM